MKSAEAIFISYAWGGPLSKKEWIREQVVNDLRALDIPIFWDRDDIKPGQRIEAKIRKALQARPINVLCICDLDYLASADKAGSGLALELEMLAEISGDEEVRITPVLLDNLAFTSLPYPLKDRASVNLSELQIEGVWLNPIVYLLATGASQTEVLGAISESLDVHRLRQRILPYTDFSVRGDPHSHEVVLDDGSLLIPPGWMLSAIEWRDRMSEKTEGFCPQKGIWHWDHWSTSTGMCALGIAICSALFHNNREPQDIAAISQCGKVVAEKIVAFTKYDEMLTINGHEILQVLIQNSQSRIALARLSL